MLTPVEIHEEMERCLQRLDDLIDGQEGLIDELATDTREYNIAHAEARIRFREENAGRSPKVTAPEVDDYATKETADEAHHLMLIDERYKANQRAIRATEAKLSALQSMSAAHRLASGG